MEKQVPQVRQVSVTRYIAPLREGGSLPGLVQADDDFLYVLKFRGAGQGKKALIAEVIGAEIARLLGLNVPEIVFAHLDEAFGRMEGDEEIQDLLKASEGLNLGIHYLSRAITFDPVATKVDTHVASKIVWLDALLMNVDRTCRNTNLLLWNKELWLIDHGAALYFHHSWEGRADGEKPFPRIKDHVLLPVADAIADVSAECTKALPPEKVESVLELIPDSWLDGDAHFRNPAEQRKAYTDFLVSRILTADRFVNEANDARKSLV